MGTERRRNREQLLVTNEQFERVPSDLEDRNTAQHHVITTFQNPSTATDSSSFENEDKI